MLKKSSLLRATEHGKLLHQTGAAHGDALRRRGQQSIELLIEKRVTEI
jgi:hypothetical protein